MAKYHHTSAENTGPVTTGRTIHWASRYDLFVSLLTLGRATAFRRHTADLAHFQSGEVVLDVGCGTGDLTLAVEKQVGPNGKVVGIDAAPEMITYARQKATRLESAVDFRVEPVEALSFTDHTFDVVISSLVFHHFPAPLKEQALVEIRRVLKPGGRVLIVDALRSSHHFFPHPALQVGAEDLLPLLQDAGFLDVQWQRGPLPFIGVVRGQTAREESTKQF